MVNGKWYGICLRSARKHDNLFHIFPKRWNLYLDFVNRIDAFDHIDDDQIVAIVPQLTKTITVIVRMHGGPAEKSIQSRAKEKEKKRKQQRVFFTQEIGKRNRKISRIAMDMLANRMVLATCALPGLSKECLRFIGVVVCPPIAWYSAGCTANH